MVVVNESFFTWVLHLLRVTRICILSWDLKTCSTIILATQHANLLNQSKSTIMYCNSLHPESYYQFRAVVSKLCLPLSGP